MQQMMVYECKLGIRFLLCQDAVFHRIPIPLDIETQRTPPKHVENQLVLDKQRNDSWVKGQPLEMEIGQGCKLTECELVQYEYLRNLRPHTNLEQIF